MDDGGINEIKDDWENRFGEVEAGLKLSWHLIYDQQVVGFISLVLRKKSMTRKFWNHQHISGIYSHVTRWDHLEKKEMQIETKRWPWSAIGDPQHHQVGERKMQRFPDANTSKSLNPHHYMWSFFFSYNLKKIFNNKYLKIGDFCFKIYMFSVCWKIQRCVVFQPVFPLDNIGGNQYLL